MARRVRRPRGLDVTKLDRTRIRAETRKLLGAHPSGISWSRLIEATVAVSPETPRNTIHQTLHQLLRVHPEPDIKTVSGELGAPERTLGSAATTDGTSPPTGSAGSAEAGTGLQGERAHDRPFADRPPDQLEDVTGAVVPGGDVFRAEWRTPDVPGVSKPLATGHAKQIVSAEIEADTSRTIVALGRAVSCRLFSDRVCIVVPSTTAGDGIDRLEASATLSGIGLGTFTLDPSAPSFELVVRAPLARPDTLYVNEMARRLDETRPTEFERLV